MNQKKRVFWKICLNNIKNDKCLVVEKMKEKFFKQGVYWDDKKSER